MVKMIYTDFENNDWKKADHKIIVFGGTGGIGGRLVERLSKTWDVGKVGSRTVDITDRQSVVDFLDWANAGIIINMSGYNYNSFLHKYNYDSFGGVEDMIDVNIYGNINILTAALPIMRQLNYGRIILASSVLSKKTMVGTSIYSASKSFLDTMVRVAAAENAHKGVTINTINMGYFDAGLTHRMPHDVKEKIINDIPAKLFGSIYDLYNLVECIIKTPYINGSNIDINGGLNGI